MSPAKLPAGSYSPNQLVAMNVRLARTMRSMSQTDAADRLAEVGGPRWSTAVWSAAERSVDGTRVRQFDANVLVALCLAFDVPLAFFFRVPRGSTVRLTDGADGAEGLPWLQYLYDILGSSGTPEDDELVPPSAASPEETASAVDSELLQRLAAAARSLLNEIESARHQADRTSQGKQR